MEAHADSTIARDAVVIVSSILATSKNNLSAEINAKVATCWKQVAASKNVTPAVLSEILNGFMDIYGDDDVHPQVFQALGLLSFFQQYVPILKQKVSTAVTTSDPDDVEVWKEAASNASQFVQYKKGHR